MLEARPRADDQLRALDLDRFYDRLSTERGLRPATVRKIHNTARGALRQALRWGLVSKNVAADASALLAADRAW
jgi:hypothetical protein